MNKKILIVDDNIRAFKSLDLNFKPLGYLTEYAANSSDAFQLIKVENFDLILLDLMLGAEDSRFLLDRIVKLKNSPPVVMITGFASINSAVDSIKRGAFDYVQKPIDFDELLKIVEKAVIDENHTSFRQGKTEKSLLEESISPFMISVLNKAKKLAVTDLPILILGENGTGKELMAEYIYHYSHRHTSQLHKINCAAFQESILDNELFGHNKGAYTGANEDYKGIFELSHGHTLFMDEIGDMSLSIQSKILRTLQNKEIRRLGSNKIITVDMRFIAATNKNVEKLISEKLFREDLYYRLNTAVIWIPPLRERVEDILNLAEYFLNLNRKKDMKKKVFSKSVSNLLMTYPWPGNIRELKNAIQYALAISSGEIIQLDDFPVNIYSSNNEIVEDFSGNIREKAEKDIIVKTLKKHSYNKSRAASDLNMSRKTLYSRIEKYGIEIK